MHRALTAAIILGSAAACHSPWRPTPTPNPPARRDVLLDPTNAHWSARAPDIFRVRFQTTKGTFVVEAYRQWAPTGVDRLYGLARAGYFDDSRFFRVLPGNIAQFGIAGDPAVTAVWKNRVMPDDIIRATNVRGMLSYAMTGPNTRTTQIYINLRDNRRLDGQGFAPIGRVVEGMEVVDLLYAGYAEGAGGGVRAGKQGRMLAEGNAHLDRDFPLLDRIKRATVLLP
jgi:cyclophilin family peptidyl-prolyl cis-trans isomerase